LLILKSGLIKKLYLSRYFRSSLEF